MATSTVKCVYTVNASGTRTPAQLAAAMAAANVPLPGWIGSIGGVLVEDVTAVAGNTAQRTIEIQFTLGGTNPLAAGADPTSFLRGFMTAALRAALSQATLETACLVIGP